ncbi:hypothetical protein [Bradyrhizobium sp. Arg816]|uniref:hypothetical protein n=1 Tax=Bradyrhizobium sp. Arg816 TaxID=2998491 RepID=UPI00249E6251|nr:hypothetical protein [Bradyrhizobium sp. Arg816]MDI3562657.1 hypothetical protein [Bradyrhizobium sp. Arg816]
MSSLPPEVEVPLPLGFDLVAVPVVCESACGVAELAAGSPVTAPRQLGGPAWHQLGAGSSGAGQNASGQGGFFLNGMEPSSLLIVILTGLSMAGSNSKRRKRWRLISNLADALF